MFHLNALVQTFFAFIKPSQLRIYVALNKKSCYNIKRTNVLNFSFDITEFLN